MLRACWQLRLARAARRVSTKASPLQFDHVVVGAGSAGAAVASRLSEDPSVSVLLLEAGKDIADTPLSRLLFRVPLLSVVWGVLLSREYNWRYESEPEPHLGGRRIYQPRGKVTGGSSSINGMIWVRGHPADYDAWAQATADARWSYENLIGAFRKCEDASALRAHGPTTRSADRGYEGAMRIADNGWVHSLSRHFLRAAQEAIPGLLPSEDFNSGDNTQGVGVYELNQHEGERWGTARAYLSEAVRARPNLTLRSSCTATRVLWGGNCEGEEGPVATGIEFLPRGQAGRQVARSRGVVLAGGVFNTPQLLMLSGVGPADELAALNIPLVCDAPGVGQNLHDHLDIGVSVENPSGEALGLSAAALPSLAAAPLRWLLGGGGLLTSNGVDAGGYVTSNPAEVDREDLQLHFFPGSLRDYSLAGTVGHQFALNVYLSRPKSRGRLWLDSADPLDKPRMVFNYLEAEEDREALVSGVRIARRILEAPALAPFRGAEIAPGAAVQTDEEVLAFLRQATKSAHHPVGTCAMGRATDPHAVLDSELRVRGVRGVRVCDASAMPSIPTSNPHSSVIAMAERCAELIQDDARAY